MRSMCLFQSTSSSTMEAHCDLAEQVLQERNEEKWKELKQAISASSVRSLQEWRAVKLHPIYKRYLPVVRILSRTDSGDCELQHCMHGSEAAAVEADLLSTAAALYFLEFKRSLWEHLHMQSNRSDQVTLTIVREGCKSEALAVALLSNHVHCTPANCEIENLAVSLFSRRLGIGTKLLLDIKACAKADGMAMVQVCTRAAVAQFYSTCGFVAKTACPEVLVWNIASTRDGAGVHSASVGD